MAGLPDAESAREAQLLESWKAYKKGFHEGVGLFNEKPKKGIAFMQVGHCIQLSAPSCFLRSSEMHGSPDDTVSPLQRGACWSGVLIDQRAGC